MALPATMKVTGLPLGILTIIIMGRRMMFMYTPVNLEGRVGDPLTATSTTVLLAPPTIEDLRIVGDLKEGNKVAVSALFTGGTEGASRVQWFKTTTPELTTEDSQVEPLSSPKVAKAFRIPLGAVGHYLVAKYTPVRSDNEVGEPVFAILSENSIQIMLRYSRPSGARSYGGLMADAFGKFGRALVQLCIIINNVGILIVYMIIIGDVLSGTSGAGKHSLLENAASYSVEPKEKCASRFS